MSQGTIVPRTASTEVPVPLPDLLPLPPHLAAAFAADWRERYARELDSATRFRSLARTLAADGETELAGRLAAAAFDEERHASVCLEVLARAGLPPPKRPEPKQRREDPLRAVVAALCIGETLAVGPLELSLERAEHPALRDAFLVLMRGEVRHARVGWAWAAESGAVALATMEPELPALAVRALTELLEEPEPPEGGAAWGLLSRAERARVLRARLCGVLVPAVAGRGLAFEHLRDAGLAVLSPYL